MASNPPFELEDQTDEDFFDKLVDDDDDDVGPSVVGLNKVDDVFDGNVSDEAKALGNLSIGVVSSGKSGFELEEEKGSDGNMTALGAEVKEEQIDDIKEEQVVDGEGNSTLVPSVSSDFFVLDNGPVSEESGVTDSEVDLSLRRENSSSSAGGTVKEVQWSAFTETTLQGISGVASFDDFLTDFGEGSVGNLQAGANVLPESETSKSDAIENSFSHAEYQGTLGNFVEQSPVVADTNSIEYWESLYPGWKYDPNTAQWYQLYGSDGTANGQESFGAVAGNMQGNFDASQVFYAQQMAQPANSQFSAAANVSDWNYTLYQNGNYQYPENMIFDANYPGWYYDTIVQGWCSLEAYHESLQSTDQASGQQPQNEFFSPAGHSHASSQQPQNEFFSPAGHSHASSQQLQNEFFSPAGHSHASSQDISMSFGQQGPSSVGLNNNLATSFANYGQQGANAQLGMMRSAANEPNQFSPGNDFQFFNPTQQVQQNGPAQYPADYYNKQQADAFTQPFVPNGHHVSSSPSEGRSSAGRPPHALVTFGFGGKLVVMRNSNNSGGFSTLGNKNDDGCLSVHNLMEVLNSSNDPSSTDTGGHKYFNSLCHQAFPGPLVGGNVGSKELNKWIDERIASCEPQEMNYGKGQGLKLLLSLLKVACQHYGKLRSFGGDTGLKENDHPELAVAKLFASAKKIDGQFGQYNAVSNCLTTLPSEAHIQATATEVQNLLISGKKVEALQRAQEGQFWEFALILSRELGEQFYADTVKQMAVSQLLPGSPLRTLCLLIAKKPEEVFVNSIMPSNNMYGAAHMSPQPIQNAGCSMLDNWEENLAVITSNRTENDHLVIIHLGDSLLKEKSDVTAAHICYLVAESGFESYSDSARLCLIGADHWNFPRTYASPEAIQRTELYEYAKVLGNSQFVLFQLQPYKLVYAHMLAEVGRVSDSLKYCQAISKSLKIGRSHEADTLKVLVTSLEERIRTHQQSGYAANLASTKIVGKIINFFDTTAHRVVGGLPPPAPSSYATQSSFQGNGNHFQAPGPKITGNQSNMGMSSLTTPASMNLTSSQSTMGMSSLMPSASMEPISQWAVDESKMTLQNRSSSEPDIGRTPRPEQANSSNETTSSSTTGKQSGSTGTSRFGRFNFGFLQKTVELVYKPKGRQAKLGEENKFYYDEKLKRWVEEGAEPSPEESALPPPPPTTAAFQNGKSDYNLKSALNDGLHASNGSPGSINSTSESSPGIPPSFSGSNQYSRGRADVRSRYVDPYNKNGGNSTNRFQAPSVPLPKPASATAPKFFVPVAVPTNDHTLAAEAGSTDVVSENGENSSMSMNDSLQNLAPSPVESMHPSVSVNDPLQNLAPPPVGTMQRFSSVGNIPSRSVMENGESSLVSQSRRTASWSAIQSDTLTQPPTSEVKASPLSFVPSGNHFPGNLHMDRNNSGDDYQEVEL